MSSSRHARDTQAGHAEAMDPTKLRRDDLHRGDAPSPRHEGTPARPRPRRMLMGFSWETARILSGVETCEDAPRALDEE